ncbi:protein translocase subunit [Martiniozyma asiatica (nom. inval.)]|nr:protein translocase subunit [Martiniozyma asiatica]
MFSRVVAVNRHSLRLTSVSRNVVANRTTFTSIRAYSEKKPLLDDDMLSKAGIDTDADVKENGENKQDEFERTKDRRNNTKSTIDKRKAFYSKMFWYSTLVSVGGFAGYLAREYDEISEAELFDKEEQGWSPGNVLRRFKKRVWGVSDVFSEPAYTELLPPPAPEQYRPPMTLVIELDDLLIHSAWDYKKGWKTAKRPGVDYFLGYLSQYYEIVVWSKSSMAFAENTVAKLDPYHAFISYSLFKEVCRSKDSKLIKDLSLMNRDLSKTIIIDPSVDAYSMQPENAIPITPWDGKKDTKLIELIPFLEWLATSRTKDVRENLASFNDKSQIPQEFAIREQQMRKEWEEAQEKKGNDIFSMLLGGAMMRKKKMPLDQIRDNGQRNYAHMARYLQEHGEQMLKEEQEKTKELMAEQKLTLGKIVNEGMPTPEELAKAAAEKQAQEAKA